MTMQWNKKMVSFSYASPPPPPPDVIPPPQPPSGVYYYPSPPPPISYGDPPSSPPRPPPPASPPLAFEPPSAPADAYSTPPETVSPPPPPLSTPPLPPPPTVIPPTSPIYYHSPPPPPHIPPLRPPPPCPSPPILPSPLPSVTNFTKPVSSPTPKPVKPKPPNPGPVHRNYGSPRNSMSTGANVATFAVVAGLVMLTFVGAAVWLVKKRRKPVELIGHDGNAVMPSPVSSHMLESLGARSPPYPLVRHGSEGSYGFPYSPSEPGLGHTKLSFSLEELSIITNNFSTQNLLGEGGSGCVYRGCLRDGREVAVKQLKVGGAQGDRQFRAEVETISRAHHRHLVSLVGYCVSENERLLVYDYVPNRTLYYHLHGKERPVLEWTIRVKIAAGAARGIAYLHEDCNPRIIHRDIKSSNILLDYNFEAKVSDFGLARSTDSNTHVSTHVMGTFGYMAPEYAKSGQLTAKSDVYSFGVVLLELITGRKPVDTSQPLGDESLAEWARPLLIQALESEDLGCLPDPRLDGNYNRDEMLRMIEVAAACIRNSSPIRPRMAQVVRALDGLAALDINNGVQPGQSEVFNSSQHSEEIRMFQRMGFSSQDYSKDYNQTD